ncbi:hypothetical protein [Pseudoxanthomonas sp. Soil82]|uniref:hypothetical protein n=1 Tax=Pseudoxanthomonas sp. Soil82 TaxID=3157341 RepID=UPI00338D8374
MPPGPRARAWLFTLCLLLPLVLTAATLAIPVLTGSATSLVGGSVPLTVALVLGGLVLLCGALWWVLARSMQRQALRVSADALEVRSSFYRCTTPLAELKLDQARVVDLDERTELKPTLKTNGFSIPGFHSGWFLLRNRRRSFVAITDGRRKLWLPGSGRHDLLIEPADPAALLARLRELAMHSGRG